MSVIGARTLGFGGNSLTTLSRPSRRLTAVSTCRRGGGGAVRRAWPAGVRTLAVFVLSAVRAESARNTARIESSTAFARADASFALSKSSTDSADFTPTAVESACLIVKSAGEMTSVVSSA